MVSNEDLSHLYTELDRDDVLLGRGTGPNGHIGNVRFRAIAMEMMLELEPSPGHSFSERLSATIKFKLAKKLCEEVRARGGKFVTKIEIFKKSGNKTKRMQGCYYQEVPLSVALEKAKQTFRHHLRVNSKPTSCGSCLRRAARGRKTEERNTKDQKKMQLVPPSPVGAPKDYSTLPQPVDIPASLAPVACDLMRTGNEEAVQILNSIATTEYYNVPQGNQMSHLNHFLYHHPSANMMTMTETIDHQQHRLSLADRNLLGLITSVATKKQESPHYTTMADRHAAAYLPHLLSMALERNRRFSQMADIQALPILASIANYGHSFDQDIDRVQKMLLLEKLTLPTAPSATSTFLRGRPITTSDMEAVILEAEMGLRSRMNNQMFLHD